MLQNHHQISYQTQNYHLIIKFENFNYHYPTKYLILYPLVMTNRNIDYQLMNHSLNLRTKKLQINYHFL